MRKPALIRFSHSHQPPNCRNRDARTSAPADDHKAVSLAIVLSAPLGTLDFNVVIARSLHVVFLGLTCGGHLHFYYVN